MDTAELTKIIELISGLGEGAKEGFVYYLVTSFAGELLVFIGAIIFFTLVFILSSRSIKMAYKESEYKSFWKRTLKIIELKDYSTSIDEACAEIEKLKTTK